MKAAVIYPHPVQLPSGAKLRLAQLVEYLRTRAESVEVFVPDAVPGYDEGNVRWHFVPYDLTPRNEPTPGGGVDAAICEAMLRLYILAMEKKGSDLGLIGMTAPGLDMLWSFYRLFNNPPMMAKIAEIVERADAVFIEYPFWARWLVPLCRKTGALSVLTAHDILAVTCPDPVFATWVAALEREAFALPDKLCAVSAADAERMARDGFAAHALTNPIDCRKGAEAPNPKVLDAMRKKYDLPAGPIAFFVGGAWFANRKAVETIMATAPQVPECTFVVAGGCCGAGRNGNFISVGILTERELQAMYHLATVILVPLRAGTGSSLKFIEAMSYGKAVITTPEGARGYPVADGKNAVLLGSEAELPAKVRELLADAPRREALGREARLLAEEYHFEKVFAPYGEWLAEAKAKRA
ncbi:MAG TPA: glycosyltransferase family 4 protein [Candidatus Methylacidiphilales bacterium]